MAWADETATSYGKIGKAKYTLTVAVAATSQTVTPIEIGAWKLLLVEVPALTGSTATVSIVDEDGTELYTSGALAESTNHSVPILRYLTGNETLKVTLDAAQSGSSAAIVVKTWFIGDF